MADSITELDDSTIKHEDVKTQSTEIVEIEDDSAHKGLKVEEKEEDDGIPENFFDDFSNNEFMEGLNVLDSWDEDPKQPGRSGMNKNTPRIDEQSPSKDKKSKRSPARRSPGNFPGTSRRGRYFYAPKSKRDRTRSRSRDRNRRESIRPRGIEERRDPNKTKIDVQKDKDKIQKLKEAKEVEKKVQVAETGLCPPGMEDMMDEVVSGFNKPKKKDLCLVYFDPTLSNNKGQKLSKDRDSSKRSLERSRRERIRSSSRGRKYLRPDRLRRDDDRISDCSDREMWLRHKRQSISLSPESRRMRLRALEEKDLELMQHELLLGRARSKDRYKDKRSPDRYYSRKRRSSERRKRNSRDSRERSLSRERYVRKRSPFLHELARTLCNKNEFDNKIHAPPAFNQNFSYPPIIPSMNPEMNQLPPINPGMYPVEVPQMIPPVMPPPMVNDGFNFPNAQQFSLMDQFQPLPPFGTYQEPQPVQAPPVFVPQFGPQPVQPPNPNMMLQRNLLEVTPPVQNPSPQPSTPVVDPKQSAFKLFEDKKITLSEFLAVSARGETLPKDVQERIKVISRCQEAIKVLDNIGKFSGRFIPKLNLLKPDDKYQNSNEHKWKSPIKKACTVKFNYTTNARRRDQEVQQSMKRLLRIVNIANPLSAAPLSPEPPLLTTKTSTSYMQTDPYECLVCVERKGRVTCTVATQTIIETNTECTQVSPNDFGPTRSILKNTPLSQSLEQSLSQSITHLTAAQLRADTTRSPHSDEIVNPFNGSRWPGIKSLEPPKAALLNNPPNRQNQWNNNFNPQSNFNQQPSGFNAQPQQSSFNQQPGFQLPGIINLQPVGYNKPNVNQVNELAKLIMQDISHQMLTNASSSNTGSTNTGPTQVNSQGGRGINCNPPTISIPGIEGKRGGGNQGKPNQGKGNQGKGNQGGGRGRNRFNNRGGFRGRNNISLR